MVVMFSDGFVEFLVMGSGGLVVGDDESLV